MNTVVAVSSRPLDEFRYPRCGIRYWSVSLSPGRHYMKRLSISRSLQVAAVI